MSCVKCKYPKIEIAHTCVYAASDVGSGTDIYLTTYVTPESLEGAPESERQRWAANTLATAMVHIGVK